MMTLIRTAVAMLIVLSGISTLLAAPVLACTTQSCTGGGTGGSGGQGGGGTESGGGPTLGSWADCGTTSYPDTLFWAPYTNPEPALTNLNPNVDFIVNSSGTVLYPNPVPAGNPVSTWNRSGTPINYNWGCVTYPGSSLPGYAFSSSSSSSIADGGITTSFSHMLVLQQFTATATSGAIGFTGCAVADQHLGPDGGYSLCSYGNPALEEVVATIYTDIVPGSDTWNFTATSSLTPPNGSGTPVATAAHTYEHVHPATAGGTPIQIVATRTVRESCTYYTITSNQPPSAPTACTTSVFSLTAGGSWWASGTAGKPACPNPLPSTNSICGTQTFASGMFDVQQIVGIPSGT